MIADGETVTLVADELDQMQNWRAAVENYGLLLVAVKIDDFFALGDGSERLRREAEGFERLGSGVQLAQAAIDEDERREVFGFLGVSTFGLGCKDWPRFRRAYRRG
jgi:hypothetical protein